MNEVIIDINDYLAIKEDIIKKSIKQPIDKLILTGIAPKNLGELFVNYSDSDMLTNVITTEINCKTIDLSNLDTSNVIDMEYMFSDCENLEEIKGLDKLDTSNVTDMQGMFCSCENLKTLDVSNFDTSKVKYMSWMFECCKNLEEIKGLDKIDTSNVTDMYSIFYNCRNLKTLDLSNFDTSKVINIGYMFEDCKNLKTLDISNFNMKNVRSTDGMFNDCPYIDTFKLPDDERFDKYRPDKDSIDLD